MASKLAQLRGKFRRAWLTTFRPGYVRQQEQRRRGQCRQCGNCCRLVHRCLFLLRSDRCLIYRLPRPANCTAFPIDERDIRDVDGECGYWFASEDVGGTDGATHSPPIHDWESGRHRDSVDSTSDSE